MKNDRTEPIPVMDYRQYRRVRRLVHECCNYIDGNCIALDDGEECVCVQSISYLAVSQRAYSVWFLLILYSQDNADQCLSVQPIPCGIGPQLPAPFEHLFQRFQSLDNFLLSPYHITHLHSIVHRVRMEWCNMYCCSFYISNLEVILKISL